MPIVTAMKKRKSSSFFKFSFLVLSFLLVQSANFLHAQTSVVTVERAQRTESKKSEDGRDLIVFSGDVFLTIEKGTTKIAISADKVNFDRDRNMLYASDKVVMVENVPDESDRTLKGNSLLMNTSTLEGVFDDVQFSQKGTNTRGLLSETTMIVSSEVFSRENGGTVVFKNASLTFCDDENPHWKLRASRIWLLSGSEFAFLNSVLYVGRVPVLYLPVFYYPKDEMIFNPAFGYRPRVGYFTQTTTYLIGRKPLPEQSDESDGLFDFAHSSQLMQQERRGLFLHNLNTPLKEGEYSKDYLKLLMDAYSNLGAMAGLQGDFAPKDSYFKQIQFSDLFGVSRNLYKLEDNALYSPYNEFGASEWNKSNIFGKQVPFRFATDLDVNGSNDYTTFHLSLPFYSDPFFKSDFLNRNENMDWLSYATSKGISTEAELEDFEDRIIDSYTWKIDGSITPDWGKASDYFNFKITSIFSSLDWNSKVDKNITSTVSPDRKFFYPSRIVPLSVTAYVDGTIFSYPPKKPEALPFTAPDIDLESPSVWLGEGEEDAGVFGDDVPFPVLAIKSPAVKEIEEFKYSLSYDYTPNFTSLYNYSADSWPNASTSSLAWKDYMSSFIGFSGDFHLKSSAVWYNGFAELNNSITFSPVYQNHPEISDKYYPTDEAKNQVRLSDYTARKLDLTNDNTLKFRPFVLNDIWSESYIAWNTQFRLVRTEFVGTAGAPAWKYHSIEGNDEAIPVHNVTTEAIAKNEDMSGSLKVISHLPPLLPKYETTVTASVPHFSSKIETGFGVRSKEDPNWDFLPFVEEISADAFNNKFRLAQSYKYQTDAHRNEYFRFSASYGGLSLSYSSLYTTGYKFDTSTGWKTDGEEKFRPYQGKISYTSPSKSFFWWKNRVGFAPAVTADFVWDFLRPPLSYFTISPSFQFRINEFIDIKFSSEHRNDVVYRYFQGALGSGVIMPGETNLWQDLMDSFNFAEYNKRKNSGFKLKSLSLEMDHNLHDWDIKSKIKVEPRLLTENGTTRYDYSPYISVSVVWKPMSAMQSNIVDEYGSVKLNP